MVGTFTIQHQHAFGVKVRSIEHLMAALGGLGIDNVIFISILVDKLPPAGLLGNGSTYAADSIFDNIGRYFYAGATVEF